MTNPLADPYFILTKIYSDGAHLKQAIAETPIEELHRARTVKIVYGVLEKDIYLSHCIRYYAPKAPKLAVRTVLKIALYMMLFMGKTRYMVTDNAVELLKKAGKGGVAGFANAFLRKFNVDEVPMPEGNEGLSVKYSYPLFAVEGLKTQYGDRAESIMAAESKGVTVRFVRNKEEYLGKEHLETPFENTYIFPNFVRDNGFFAGDYTFQSVGSIAICHGVAACENMLDACAAPGGKSVLLAAKCKQVTAFELHVHRVKLIEEYTRRMGVENVTALQKDSSVYDENYLETFDGVLCDVPCSGMGTVCENPDVKLNKTKETLKELPPVQLAILTTCAKYVKKGGDLYYSTCSIFQEENDGVVGAFLRKNPEFTVVTTDNPLPHETTKYGLQFLPDQAFGAGFYFCKLHRKD
jgi:16S rRNA (cytosine967-C5)-methyltransferase